MSFSYRVGSYDVKPTADETVPRMNDNTNEEQYYSFTRITISGIIILLLKVLVMMIIMRYQASLFLRSFYLSPGILSLLGLSVLIVGVWALVQA